MFETLLLTLMDPEQAILRAEGVDALKDFDGAQLDYLDIAKREVDYLAETFYGKELSDLQFVDEAYKFLSPVDDIFSVDAHSRQSVSSSIYSCDTNTSGSPIKHSRPRSSFPESVISGDPEFFSYSTPFHFDRSSAPSPELRDHSIHSYNTSAPPTQLSFPLDLPYPATAQITFGPASTKSQSATNNLAIDSPYYYLPQLETWILGDLWLVEYFAFNSSLTAAQTHFFKGDIEVRLISINLSHTQGCSRRNSSAPTTPVTEQGPFFRRNSSQPAQMPLTNEQTINLHLIRSCAYLASSRHMKALEYANTALQLAESEKLYHEICKSQLYRGLAFMKLKQWRNAKEALVRAANVRGWAHKVEALTREVQEHLDKQKRRRVTVREE